MKTEGQKTITQMTLSFDCTVEKKADPPAAPSAEKLKEENKARFMKIKEEALHSLQEITTNSHSRPIHLTSHKLCTMLYSYMQQTGISQRDAEQSRLNQIKPKITSNAPTQSPEIIKKQ